MTTLSIVGSMDYNPGDNGARAALIDPANGFIYSGLAWGGNIIKVSLASFSEIASIGSGISFKQGHAIDLVNQIAYFGSNQSPSRACKVDLATFTEVANIATGGLIADDFVLDVAGGYLYCGDTTAGNDSIRKIRLSDFTLNNSIVATIGSIGCSVIDPPNHFAYFGGYTPNSIYKLNLTTFTKEAQLNFVDGEAEINTGIIDLTKGFSYWGDYSAPAYIIKVRLSDFTKVDRIQLKAGENYTTAAAIDTDHQFAYFVSNSNPATLVKINLSTFKEVESIVITGSYGVNDVVIDPTTGFIYCLSSAGAGVPGKIIKILDSDLYVAPTASAKKVIVGNTGKLGFTKKGAFINKASGKGATFS